MTRVPIPARSAYWNARMRWAPYFLSVLFACWAAGMTNHALAKPSNSRMTPLVRAIGRVRPAVVNIHSEKNLPAQSSSSAHDNVLRNRMSGMGTGVVVDERGYIVTNYHVIEDVHSIRVTLVDGATYTAEVLARDREIDLALLKIEPRKKLSVMPMGSSSDLMHGETVVAIGNAFGYEHTITRGIISELHRDVRLSEKQSYRNLIQTDASINPGNSGGPLINVDGQMIGLNVAIRAGAQGIGFAIPVDELKGALVRLLSIRRLNKTWHGIVYKSIASGDDSEEIVVERVEPDSPAVEAGIQIGDRLIAVDGFDIDYVFDVERAMLDKRESDRIEFRILRDGKEHQKTLTLQSIYPTLPSSAEIVWRRLGVRLSDNAGDTDVRRISAQLKGGLQVIQIADDGAAQRAGLRFGDVLVGLQEWETLSVENVVYVLNHHEDASPLRFYVIRGNEIHRGWLTVSSN